MLLTGVDHHRAGLGNLAERLSANQKGQPGYEGRLNDRVVTLAELLRKAGYRTFMTGKWHLGSGPADPAARGFERAFALLESGAGHFANMQPLLGPGKAEYSEDGAPVTSLPDDFYSSRFYVEKLIEYLDAQPDSGRPFFAYLSFTAPHFPLQARRATIDKYRGRYDSGYDDVLAGRLGRMQEAGLLPADVEAFPQLASELSWTELDAESRRRESRRMEIYAAMIDDLDTEVGTLVSFLKERKLYDDTVIVFLSDNGAEGHYLRWGLDPLVPWAQSCCDNGLENMGEADSYVMLGPAWARVAMTPFRMFKGFTSEGGIKVPAFVHYPAQVEGNRSTPALATVKDVLPTVLELAGIELPGTSFDGRGIEAVQGRSLVPLLEGRADHVHPAEAAIGWEIFGKRALRQGGWKILWETADATWWDAGAMGIKRNAWQLYDLASDPAELEDLSESQPRRLEAMIRAWQDYVRENGVVIPDRQRGY
jgi:arylsulfatase